MKTNNKITALASQSLWLCAIAIVTLALAFTTCDDKDSTVSVTGVTLNETALTLDVDDSETLTATVQPTDATNKAVTWSTSDNTTATVSQTGEVTAVAYGTTTITVTTADGNKTANCTVEVRQPPTPQVPQPTPQTLSFGTPACIVTISSPDKYTTAEWTALVGEVAAALEAAYSAGGGAVKGRFGTVFGASANGKIVLVNDLSNNWEVRTGELDTIYLKTSSIGTANYASAVAAMVNNAPEVG